MAKKKKKVGVRLSKVPNKVLAGMVRDGCCTKGETIDGWLLVLAVSYGKVDDVTTLPEAMEAFQRLVVDEDWTERQFMVMDSKGKVREVSYEEVDK